MFFFTNSLAHIWDQTEQGHQPDRGSSSSPRANWEIQLYWQEKERAWEKERVIGSLNFHSHRTNLRATQGYTGKHGCCIIRSGRRWPGLKSELNLCVQYYTYYVFLVASWIWFITMVTLDRTCNLSTSAGQGYVCTIWSTPHAIISITLKSLYEKGCAVTGHLPAFHLPEPLVIIYLLPETFYILNSVQCTHSSRRFPFDPVGFFSPEFCTELTEGPTVLHVFLIFWSPAVQIFSVSQWKVHEATRKS